MELEAIKQAIRTKNIHFPKTTLLCLENTHNRCGGAVLTPEYTSAAAEVAHENRLRVHLDGARIFNAAIALNIPASELARDVDSVCFCLSKGLSAPVGSLLCGTREFVESARKWRKMLGGGMRQAGVLAAAGIVALQTMIERLKEDHDNAKRLAHGLARIPGITVQRPDPPTNIVLFRSFQNVPGLKFMEQMNSRGVRLSPRGSQDFRAVTHRMISATDVDEALTRIRRYAKEIR